MRAKGNEIPNGLTGDLYINVEMDYMGYGIDGSTLVKEVEINVLEAINGVKKEINTIKCYTTRPDTLFGFSFLALSVDHPISRYYENNDQFKEFKKNYKIN